MLLGLPLAHDEIMFNVHKIYGPLQMSHILANWEQIHADNITITEDKFSVLVPSRFTYKTLWLHQPGIVLQKKENKL